MVAFIILILKSDSLLRYNAGFLGQSDPWSRSC